MTFISYPDIKAVSAGRTYRLEVVGQKARDSFRDQSKFVYRLIDLKSGRESWRWQPAKNEGLADFPHEAWVNDEGWSVARLHEWFHAGILVISPQGECRMLRLIQSFDRETAGILQDESDTHIGGTSAGPNWDASSIACFYNHDGKPYWSILTWWGRRITIDLEAGEVVDEVSAAQARVNSDAEQAWILSQLQRASSELQTRDDEDPQWWSTVARPIYAAAYHAGKLKVREAIPILQLLEENPITSYSTSATWFEMTHLPFRLIAKVSLLELNVEPKWLANFRLKRRRAGHRWNYPACRLQHPVSIREGMSQRDVLNAVGVPEYIKREQWDYWFLEDGAAHSIRIHWHDKHEPQIDWRNAENVAARLNEYREAVEREPPVASRVERSDRAPWSADAVLEYSIAHDC